MDGWVDLALNYCESEYGRLSPAKLLFKLVILYMILAALCHSECLFRKQGIELEAKLETIGEVLRGGRCSHKCSRVRYHYRDPHTGRSRFNTITIPNNLVPIGPTATIEYIPGEPPITRLKQQARPILISVFFWVNVIVLTAIAGVIGWIAWEANHPIRQRVTSSSSGKLRQV